MVALVGLPALVGVMVVLGLVSAAAPWLPPRGIAPATAGLCLLGLAFGLALVSAGGQARLLGGALAADPLGAFFLLPPLLAGLAAACFWLGQPAPASLPGFVAAALLVVLAGDARTAILGLSVFALAASGWTLRLSVVAGVFLLAGAFAMLAAGAGPAFPLMRANPPDGWRGAAVLVLTLLGLAPLAGWAPWHRPFLALAPSALPVAAITPVIGLYVAVRVLADLCGPAVPGWWSLPLLLAGAASAGLGVVAALRSPVFGGVLAGLAVQHGGWMLAGLGVAVAARSADVLPLATLAMGGAMLHALNHTLFASLATLSAEAAAIGAGSRTLDRLGGLAARMPVVAIGMLTGGLSLALLPPSAGFASGWMLLQALFAAPRVGGLPLQLVVAAVTGALGLSAGFGMVAAVRLGGVAFLGRPRTPRAAAAEDSRPARRGTILGLTVLCGVAGLLPGVALRLAGQAQHAVTAAGLDGQGGWSGVRTQLDTPGYAPLGIAALMAAVVGLIAILARSGVLPGAAVAPAWEGGYAAPPAWMPFGEPSTQVTASALAATVPRRPGVVLALPRFRLRAGVDWPAVGPRHAAAAILAALVLLLLAVAAFRPA